MSELNIPHLFIKAGEVKVSKQPCIFRTTLGSCVAVCLYDPNICSGGMNHIMHIGINQRDAMDMRWSNIAISKLIYKMQLLGSNPGSLHAKVIGGGKIMASFTNQIGQRNAQAVLEELDVWKIPIIYRDIGGLKTRQLQFNSFTGKVNLL